MSIPFTQFLLPDGRQGKITIDRPAEVEKMAEAVIASGLRFEVEMLSDYKTVSLTAGDPVEEIDHFMELAPNGLKILDAVDKGNNILDSPRGASHSSFYHLAWSIWGNRDPDKCHMGMFTTYFDASGQPDQPVLFVSGFISSETKWLRFEKEWGKLLHDYGIKSPFHTTNYVATRGQDYEVFRGDDALKDEFEERAILIIKRNTRKPFSYGLLLDEVKPIFARYEVPKEYTDSPYAFCGMVTAREMVRWTKEKLSGEDKIEVVFEDGDDDASVLFDLFKKTFGCRPSFRTKKDHPQFQAADILAWRHRRLVMDRLVRRKDPDREAFGILFKHIPQDRCVFLRAGTIEPVLDAWGWELKP